ncbi:MAG TPA: flavodoxin family protein [Candidatus Nanoarchaeia archaeon]|nr:flavodoxin family protein [Candidatus Nanoarchaeia archaeon]
MITKKLTDQELMKVLEVDSKTLARFKEIQQETIKEAKDMAGKKNKNKKIRVLGISGSARDKYDMAQEESNSEELLKVCLENCKKLGAETELIKLREYRIEHCKACYSTTNTQCHFYCSCYPKGTPKADDMSNILYDKVLEADAIIFATPVNNFNVSTLMKAFIDRCISLDGSLQPANPKVPKDKELNIKHMKFVELTANNDIPGSGMLRRFTGKVAGVIVTGHEEGAAMVISNLFMTFNHFGMLFPPFSNMYAMSSVCNSTYADKKIVLTDCFKGETKLLAQNVMHAAELLRNSKPTDWKYDYDSD